MAEGMGAEYKLSATLLLNDQLSGKLKSAASQLKSMDGSVGKLAREFDALKNLRAQVEQFKQLKKSVAATQQAYNQANGSVAQLARQYRQGQATVAQLKAKHDSLQTTFEASQSATAQLKNKLGGLKSEADKLKTAGARDEYQKLQAQIKSTSEQLKASQATTRQTGTELKTLAGGIRQAQRELNGIGRAFEESKSKAASLKRELTQQRPILDQMRRSLAAQGFSTRDFVQSERDLRRREQNLSPPAAKPISVNVSGNATSRLAQIKAQLQSLTGKAWNVAVNTKNALGGRISDFATGAAFGLGVPFLGTAGVAYGGVDIIKTYKDFEYEMKTVSAITGAYRDESGQRLAELTNLAKYYGETTMFKASEVASAEKFMGMAGWSDSYIKAGLKPMLDLAAASGEDLRRTSDIVTDAMTAFHLKPEEMYKLSSGEMVNVTEHFTDVMAALATSSNTDVGGAGESAKYSAAIIGSMYASQSVQDRMHGMEDWAVFQGLMADTGIKNSMAGTATRSIFTRLASMQMNADAARDILGVDLVYREDDEFGHEAGQMRRSLDIINDFRKKFQGGFQTAEELMNAVEYFDESGKRFTKQQRRKIGAMLESAQKNGGKMTDKDILAMTNMLSGQEALSGMLALITADDETWNKKVEAIQNAHGRAGEMADVKMDTLEGDLKTLGSAWEAFQLELMSGKGAEGFREFAKGLTDDIRSFKKAIEDGFDIGDIGGLIARVVTQLKNKFLEFDGIGSILAGGALVMGLKKIYDSAMKLKEAAAVARSWWAGSSGRPPSTGGVATQSIGSMTVHAGTVVVNGKVAGGTTGRKVGNTAFVDSYYARKEQVLNSTAKFANMRSAAGGAALFTALFGALDIYATREQSAARLKEANATLDYQKQVLADMQAEGRSQTEINQQLNEIRNAQAFRDQTLQTNRTEELKASMGAVGSVAGSAIGAAIGSLGGPLGIMIGGMIGGVIGDMLGKTAAEHKSESDASPIYRGGVSEQTVSDYVAQYTGFHEEKTPKAFSEFEGDLWENQQSQRRQGLGLFVAPGENFFGYNGETFHAVRNEQVRDWEQMSELRRGYGHGQARVETPIAETTDQMLARLERETQASITANQAELQQRKFDQYTKQAQSGTALWSQGSTYDAYAEGQKVLSATTDHYKQQQREQNLSGLQSIGNFFRQYLSETEKFSQEQSEIRQQAHAQQIEQEKSAQNSRLQNSAQAISEWGETFSQAFDTVGEFFDGLFFNKAAAAELTDEQRLTEGQPPREIEPNISGIKLPDFKQLWADFNIADFLPDIDFSQWFEGIELPDLSTLLPDFSSIGSMVEESLSAIPAKISSVTSTISENFNRIPSVASEAFNTVSTAANEKLNVIQSAWGQLPAFFDGIFSGLGSVASAAGSAIAAGINSGIGIIQSAWESLSSWLSAKISSLSSMASSVANFVNIGGRGHNATGTTSWRGGWTEVNEHGGEIINLPSGTTIYPHATTMKMLEREIQNGTFDNFISPSESFNFTGETFSDSSIPEVAEMPTVTQNQTSSTSNNDITITGNTFVVRKDSDINEIAFKLLELMRDSNANYAGA